MASLVNYSDSGSDSEVETSTPAAPVSATKTTTLAAPATAKKPFQRLVDRSNPGKILVNLPQTTAGAGGEDPSRAADGEPPSKRARTAGGGGGRFSAFRAALPAPKKTTSAIAAPSSVSADGKKAPVFSFKTSSEVAFSRDTIGAASASSRGGADDGGEDGGDDSAGGTAVASGSAGLKLNLPPPKSHQHQQQPLQGQKPEEELKLVGTPSAFMPLSVARRKQQAKKNGVISKLGGGPARAPPPNQSAPQVSVAAPTKPEASQPVEPPKKKKTKVSLFSLGDDDGVDGPTAKNEKEMKQPSGTYEPLFEDSIADPTTGEAVYSDYASYQAPQELLSYLNPTIPLSSTPQNTTAQTLDAMADDMNLSRTARRELFGRGGSAHSSNFASSSSSLGTATVKTFDMEREYRQNEELIASGELAAAQPARAVKGIAPGKHNLRQLVNAVQSQREALEESFAKNRSNQREVGARYGWR